MILFVCLKILVLFFILLVQFFWSLTPSHFIASKCCLLFFSYRLLFLSFPFMLHTHKSAGDGSWSYIWGFMLHCSLSGEKNIFVLAFFTKDLKFTLNQCIPFTFTFGKKDLNTSSSVFQDSILVYPAANLGLSYVLLLSYAPIIDSVI